MRDDIAIPAALRGHDPARRNRPAMLPLRVENLTLEAGGQRLLDGVSFGLSPGGITVIMGPNGAGKSLLLALLHGLRAPTGGTVDWSGIGEGPALRKRQAMVFQKPVLLRRSVAANVDFALRARGLRDAPRRDALLEAVGLLPQSTQPARQLSGGEQQRLALARALATEPEVLLLDEPTASLDPASALVIERIVMAAHDAGTKIIFVTHDLGQARRLADDIVFLHQGRIAEQGPATAFFDAPQSEAARAYLDGRIVL